ncbi:outer membrane beta-barrel domain-containing protein [Pendulispora albinea]|uniref:Outer membrane beta-barrel domain-containing protein n=1 Tax=Pendulispora albinea TaxID=2741071 RepID=A0ABZ2M2T5_9BACT
MLSASSAMAQKKGGGKKPTKPPAGAPGTTTPAGTVELDQPAPPPTPPPGQEGTVELDQPGTQPAQPAPPPPTAGATGGICDIDPSACPKAADVKAAASKDIHAEIYAVQQIYALRARRFEINPFWGFTLNDQFVNHPGPGLAINYYLSNVLAIGLNGNFYHGLNGDSDFNFENRRATHVAAPLNEYQFSAALNFTYVPMYGKFAAFGDFIFHYDAYVVGGVGAISTRPIPVIDPDNRKFDYEMKVAFNAGLGLRIFLNRWFAVNAEVRDYIFSEKLESLTIAQGAGKTDKGTWYGENQLTNNVQAQIGVSVFIPFSWDYRLPK